MDHHEQHHQHHQKEREERIRHATFSATRAFSARREGRLAKYKSTPSPKTMAMAFHSPAVRLDRIQAITPNASTGMRPEQLIAFAFQELAGKADKIGQLNISPDLLRELMSK